MAIQKQDLHNNVVLITEPVAGVKTAAIGFWFPVGSRDETEKMHGASHFVEHMLFKGTKTRGAYDIACAFDRIGGYANAFTERELTCVYCLVPSVYATQALEIMCDMLLNSVFIADDVSRECEVIESEIVSSLDDPEDAAYDAVMEKLWPGHPVSHSISGSVRQIRSLDRASLFSWYQDSFLHGALAVTAAGCIDTDFLVKMLDTMPLRPVFTPGEEQKMPPVWKPGRHFIKSDFLQPQFFASFPLPFPFDAHTYDCWSVLNAIIGDTMSSRLFQELREKNGYCYSVYSFLTLFRDAGFWCAYASPSKERALDAAVILQTQLYALMDGGVSAAEIEAAKEHIRGEEIIAAEDMESRMKRLARLWFCGFDLITVEKSIESVCSLTVDELQNSLHTVINKETESLIMYGPKIRKLKLEKL